MKTVVETLDQTTGKKWLRNECDEKWYHFLCNPSFVLRLLEDCQVTFMQDRIHAGQLYFSTCARVQLDRTKFFKAQRLNVNSWPPPFHPYIKKTTNTNNSLPTVFSSTHGRMSGTKWLTTVCPPYFSPHRVGCHENLTL